MVLRLANRYLRRVLITSTSEIYGKSEATPFREDDDRVLGPTTQKPVELLLLQGHRRVSRSRLPQRKKPPEHHHASFQYRRPAANRPLRYGYSALVQQALKNQPLTVYGDGKQVRCFTYVPDVVAAAARLMETPEAIGQVFNIGNTEGIAIGELAEKIKALTGSKSEIVLIPYDKAYEEGFEDMRIRVPDLSKANRVIDYEPKSNWMRSSSG